MSDDQQPFITLPTMSPQPRAAENATGSRSPSIMSYRALLALGLDFPDRFGFRFLRHRQAPSLIGWLAPFIGSGRNRNRPCSPCRASLLAACLVRPGPWKPASRSVHRCGGGRCRTW
jgi:hypothetical protein